MEFFIVKITGCQDQQLWYSELIGYYLPVVKIETDLRYFFTMFFLLPGDVEVVNEKDVPETKLLIPNFLQYGVV